VQRQHLGSLKRKRLEANQFLDKKKNVCDCRYFLYIIRFFYKISMIIEILIAIDAPNDIMSLISDIFMKHSIHTTEELGLVIRAVRKSTRVRQDDLAALVGVSRQFAVDVEKGKPTVQMARVMRLLKELGIELSVDIPLAATQELERLRLCREAATQRTKDGSP
jgi:y4mF family transcriptional regulator